MDISQSELCLFADKLASMQHDEAHDEAIEIIVRLRNYKPKMRDVAASKIGVIIAQMTKNSNCKVTPNACRLLQHFEKSQWSYCCYLC